MIPTKELVRNPNFKGLKIDQSKNLDNYVHLRQPSLSDKKLLIGTFFLMKKAGSLLSVTIFWTLSARTLSKRAGHYKPTSRRLR